MQRAEPINVVFYRTTMGREPVREWLKSLQVSEKKSIGEDIKTVQFGWPMGMPIVEKLDRGLWEVRTILKDRISRVLFTVHENNIVLLHGFIKKSQKILKDDLDIAYRRMMDIKRG
jgi:phage-related protein